MSWRRAIYSLVGLLVVPALPLRLWWRGRHEAGYREHLGERFGRYRTAAPADIWIHAVSVGETRAAAPLVAALKSRHPGARILLTHMTPSGRDAARPLLGEGVAQAYLPYDLGFAVRAFMQRFRPRLGILMETELWPNLVAIAREQGVPLYLANARLSARSARRYARLGRLAREMLGALSGVGAQTPADAERLHALGVSEVSVTGNLKFDIDVPPAMLALGVELRLRFGAQRPVWLAASTREGEESLLVDVLDVLPGAVLTVIVPRHPRRFGEVAEMLTRRGVAYQRRSGGEPIAAATRVVLGDSMGEMFAYYAAADVAFIGGSLLPFGAQNLLEACAVGTPALFGPHTFNFAHAASLALDSGAALRVGDANELVRVVDALLRDGAARTRMGEAGKSFYRAHRGATARTLELLAPALAALGGDGR